MIGTLQHRSSHCLPRTCLHWGLRARRHLPQPADPGRRRTDPAAAALGVSRRVGGPSGVTPARGHRWPRAGSPAPCGWRPRPVDRVARPGRARARHGVPGCGVTTPRPDSVRAHPADSDCRSRRGRRSTCPRPSSSTTTFDAACWVTPSAAASSPIVGDGLHRGAGRRTRGRDAHRTCRPRPATARARSCSEPAARLTSTGTSRARGSRSMCGHCVILTTLVAQL